MFGAYKEQGEPQFQILKELFYVEPNKKIDLEDMPIEFFQKSKLKGCLWFHD